MMYRSYLCSSANPLVKQTRNYLSSSATNGRPAAGNKLLHSDVIIEILMKPLHERLTVEAKKVARAISHFKFFQLLAEDIDSLVHLCRRLTLKKIRKNEYLFREGDPGDFFYVLYEGGISITRFVQVGNRNAAKNEKILKLLHKGDTFGETALKTVNGKRGANAKCGDQDSLLIVVQCEDFMAIEKEHEIFLKAQKMTIVERCPAFQGFTKRQLREVVEKMNVKRYDAGTVITSRYVRSLPFITSVFFFFSSLLFPS